MAKNGFSMSNRVAVEEVTGAKTLTANDCGKHLLINASASANYKLHYQQLLRLVRAGI